MDPLDYTMSGVIGNNNTEVDCNTWADIYSTYQQVIWDHTKKVIVYFNNMCIHYYLDQTPEYLRFKELFSNVVDAGYAFGIKAEIYFNSLRCPSDQRTGVEDVNTLIFNYQSGDLTWETGLSRGDAVDFPNQLPACRIDFPDNFLTSIDFTGKTTFIEQYYNDHIEAFNTYNDAIKKCFTYVNGTRFPKTPATTQPTLTGKCDMPTFTNVFANINATSVTLNANLTSIGTLPSATIIDVGFYFSSKSGYFTSANKISLSNTLGAITTTEAIVAGTTYNWTPYVEFDYNDNWPSLPKLQLYSAYTPEVEEFNT